MIVKNIRITKKGNRSEMNESLRFQILNRDNFTCQYCGAKAPDVKLQVDHIVPIKKGGSSDTSNLIAACEVCNGGKGTKVIKSDSLVLDEIKELETEEGKVKHGTTICFDRFDSYLSREVDGEIIAIRIVRNK